MPTSKNPSASDDDTKQPDENATSNDSQQNVYIEDLIKSGKAAVSVLVIQTLNPCFY